MKQVRLQAVAVAGLLVGVLAPSPASAQRSQQPIPIFLAVTFKSPGEAKLGMDVAESVRQRMMRFYPPPAVRSGSVRIVTQAEINAQLGAAGFPADSVISTNDLRDLGRGIGAAESMEGTVKRTAQGVEARARVYLFNNILAPEVLPVVIEKDAGAAGRKLAEEFMLARKAFPAYDRCKNALVANQFPQAIEAANAALAQYDKGVLPRACLLTAYNELFKLKQMPIDSVMRVATEIVAMDSENEIATTMLVNAYNEKGDTAKALEMSMKLFRLNPTNTPATISLIQAIGSFGAPDSALVVVQALIDANPGDPAILEQKWKLQLRKKDWRNAVATGEEMVKYDSTRSDTAFFARQIGAAYLDSQPKLALEYLKRATQKFPRDVFLLQAYLLELKKQGQLPQAIAVAKQVLGVDPHANQGYATVISLYLQMDQPDSAIAFAKQSLAGADSATRTQIGQGLNTMIAPALEKAQKSDSTTPADMQKANWTQVLRFSAAVDSIVPQRQTAYYMSVAAYYAAQYGLANVAEVAKSNRPAACASLKDAADNLVIVDLNMSRGAMVDQKTAVSLLQAVSANLRPYIESARKQYLCR